jgi:hypothetical protein
MGRRLTLILAVAVAGLGLLGTSLASATTYTIKGGENAQKNTEELLAAVEKVNASTGANTIVLGSGSYLPEKVITFTNTAGATTIEGPSGTPTTNTLQATLSGSGLEKITELIVVEPQVSLKLKNLEVDQAGGEGYPAIELVGENDKTKIAGASLTIENALLANTGSDVAVQPGATLSVRNSTISDGRSFGILNNGKTAIFNSTIAFNKEVGLENSGEETALTNTIVAENKGGDCLGTVTSSDHSLDSDGSCGVGNSNGNLGKTNPLLSSSLANNGGSTPLHSVTAKSPAINAGDKSTCLSEDQRHAPRPGITGDACTIGADEYDNVAPSLTLPSNITKEAEAANGSVVTFTTTAVGVEDLAKVTCSPASGSTFAVGTTKVKCTAVDGHENSTSGEFTVTITAKAPAVTTGAASAITSTTATLNGTINPDGASVTACTFEYGTSVSYGKTASCSSLPGSGTSAVAVSAPITGLTASQTYDFRLVATNSTGTTKGANETFKAAAAAGPENYANGKLLSTTHTPVTGFGSIQLISEVIGEVKCQNTFYGQAWNQAVGSETKGVGEIEGWGTANCTAPTYIPSLEIGDKEKIEKKEVRCEGGYPGTEIGKGKCFTVYATAELPLEVEKQQAEVCKTETKKLSECTGAGEKKEKTLISAVRRRLTSTPWKAELNRTTREGNKVIAQRTGVHTFGEPGAGEDAQNEEGACYPKEGGKSANYKAVPSGCVIVNVVFPQIPDEVVFYGSQEAEGINGSKNGLFPSKLVFNEESGNFFSSEDSAGEKNETAGEVKLIGTNAVELLTTK